MKLVSVVPALLIVACVSIPFASARAQSRSRSGGPDKRDTMPLTRVILVPAVERYNTSQIGRAIKDLKVLAVYTTDGQVARAMAAKLQADVGGPLIPFERAGKSVDDFARVLVDSVVEKAARRNMDRAILVVAEPELFRPFLHGSLGEREAKVVDDGGPIGTFIVFVRADNRRLVSRTAY